MLDNPRHPHHAPRDPLTAQNHLNRFSLDWLASSFAAPAWRTNATTVYAVGTILTAILTVVAIGALTYLALYTTPAGVAPRARAVVGLDRPRVGHWGSSAGS